MTRRIAIVVAVFTLVFSPASMAQQDESASTQVMSTCNFPAKPEIPNGRTSTEEEMLTAQGSLKDYLAEGEEYMACLKKIELGWGEEATEEQRAVLVIFHNRMVDEMQSTADLFNQAVRAFKGKKGG